MRSIRQALDITPALRVFALTFAASAVVTGFVAHQAEGLGIVGVAWQSALIGALVAAGSGLWFRPDTDRPAAGRRPDGAARTEPRAVATPDAGREPASAAALEEHGITAKLLELIALGDRYGNTFSLMLISVDLLDEINANYGSDATDRLLGKISRALAHTLRMPDRVGELGRGTYLVVLPETNLTGAIQIAERLRGAVSTVDIAVSQRVHVHTTASAGVTSFRRGDDLQGLLNRAEKALHEAQAQGRNRVLPDLAA